MKLSLSLTTLFVLVTLVGGCEPAFGEDDEELDLSSSGTTDDVASFDAATPDEFRTRSAGSRTKVCVPDRRPPPPVGGGPITTERPKPCPKP